MFIRINNVACFCVYFMYKGFYRVKHESEKWILTVHMNHRQATQGYNSEYFSLLVCFINQLVFRRSETTIRSELMVLKWALVLKINEMFLRSGRKTGNCTAHLNNF